MPYDFPPVEQVEITSHYHAAPGPNAAGNFVPMYEYIGQRLEAAAAQDQDVRNSWRWFLTAAQANAGEGLLGGVIISYTRRQGVLHDVPFVAGVGPLGIQEASNQVARNVYAGLLNGVAPSVPPWRAPPINIIAEQDATAVGQILFGERPQDTAFTANAAWGWGVRFTFARGVSLGGCARKWT